jgi:UDPglucose 6-dehydrogenase
MHIAVIGSGYVGLVTGACFAEFGVDVICVDVAADKIERLTRGESPTYEPGLEQLVRKNLDAGRLSFTTDMASAIKQSLVIFIAVGTPPGADGSADLSFVESAARSVAEHMDSYKVIATKSTVPVGTGKQLMSVISRHQKTAIEFSVISIPEFLREGTAIGGVMRPDRVVIGGRNPEAIAIMRDLYRPLYLIETPFVITSLEGAELIESAANAFVAYDPASMSEPEEILRDVQCAANEYEAANGADALAFVTEWNQFRALDMLRIRQSMRVPRIADLRNIFTPSDTREMGFEYVGVGQ